MPFVTSELELIPFFQHLHKPYVTFSPYLIYNPIKTNSPNVTTTHGLVQLMNQPIRSGGGERGRQCVGATILRPETRSPLQIEQVLNTKADIQIRKRVLPKHTQKKKIQFLFLFPLTFIIRSKQNCRQ
uniref:Uncharacterized protein n=1 Tax=Strigamia maritima TaxID=126957 RepID=T1JBP9_STRMM